MNIIGIYIGRSRIGYAYPVVRGGNEDWVTGNRDLHQARNLDYIINMAKAAGIQHAVVQGPEPMLSEVAKLVMSNSMPASTVEHKQGKGMPFQQAKNLASRYKALPRTKEECLAVYASGLARDNVRAHQKEEA